MQGTYSVAVVDPNNTIRFSVVKVGDRIGSDWIVEQGGEGVGQTLEGFDGRHRRFLHLSPGGVS
jgi:hypothetical protein